MFWLDLPSAPPTRVRQLEGRVCAKESGERWDLRCNGKRGGNGQGRNQSMGGTNGSLAGLDSPGNSAGERSEPRSQRPTELDRAQVSKQRGTACVPERAVWSGSLKGEERLKEVIAVLNQLAKEKFWGNVQRDFRDGEVTVLRKTETVRMDGDRNNLPNERTRFSQ